MNERRGKTSPHGDSLLIGTGNPGKVREFKELLKGLNLNLSFLSDFDGATEVAETGVTFEENARLKVEGYAALLPGGWIAAEDSGLVVPALGGDPGVYSARYGGLDDDRARNDLLLKRMSGCVDDERVAYYEAVLVLLAPGGEDTVFRGRVWGRITQAPDGHAGFGYDPIFFHPSSKTTFGRLSREEKGRCSHRALAALAMKAYLEGETQ